MTFISNDPSWWPTINLGVFDSYWMVAAGIIVVYDWVLTLGQEIELIWLIGQTTEELILPGTYLCVYGMEGGEALFISMIWMLNTIWEVLALCLSVWVAMKHFREQRLNQSTGSTIGDYFRVLIQSHVLYFASFVSVSCLQLANVSPSIANSISTGSQILYAALLVLAVVQMFVLGPRLILSIREYHAKLVEYSDAEISMNTIVFQERNACRVVCREEKFGGGSVVVFI
ncbi:uncharacterized protein F5147DRAFT_837409 [Suillus discolor]|uniref:DUF6533 domain-containing protein n=1 Tax=Suillus discolor TaxID=1912936 RepID=A0A9P7F6T9_9AGAM|nr:uncharacterized protein F5147DRAFT_837409 [Suillus discolor]KAG2107136.1 hypothetical protein F5147DRAFT_837409 [Suillus discolor]